MNIEEVVTSAIAALVSGRMYWDTTPQSGPPKDVNGVYLPFCVAQLIGGMDETYIDQRFPDYEHHRLQVVAYSPSSLTASALIRIVRTTLLAALKPADIVGSPIAVYDPALLLRGRLQHFSIWNKP